MILKKTIYRAAGFVRDAGLLRNRNDQNIVLDLGKIAQPEHIQRDRRVFLRQNSQRHQYQTACQFFHRLVPFRVRRLGSRQTGFTIACIVAIYKLADRRENRPKRFPMPAASPRENRRRRSGVKRRDMSALPGSDRAPKTSESKSAAKDGCLGSHQGVFTVRCHRGPHRIYEVPRHLFGTSKAHIFHGCP